MTMAGLPNERRLMAMPLVLSALLHAALISSLSNAALLNASSKQEYADVPPPQRHSQSADNDPPIQVELHDDSTGLLRRSQQEPCDPASVPEYFYFDIAAGDLGQRVEQVARQSRYAWIMDSAAVRDKSSRTLRGWFRPFDAARLLAGDAGLCASDFDDTIVVHICHDREVPFDRGNEPVVKRDRQPPDCAATPTTPSPRPIMV